MLPSEADLQLLFARLNNEFFQGQAPDCIIAYNARFSNSAARITYNRRPLLIEVSPRHLRKYPDSLQDTLLHEMIHAWCYDRWRETGHGARFRRKMRDCGMRSIYHDLGSVRSPEESGKRYVLRCEQCGFEALRRRKPGKPASCPRCNKRRFDARFPLTIYEVTGMKAVGTTLDVRQIAARGA